MWHKKFVITSFVILLVGVGFALVVRRSTPPTNTESKPSPKQTSAVPSFDKKQYSLSNPESLWVIVNKRRALPSNYKPKNLVVPAIALRSSQSSEEMHLRNDTSRALEQMAAAAKREGITLMLASGYRSYNLQTVVYNNEVMNYGQAKADSESARPGHSEHQTGLSADLAAVGQGCLISQCFADTPAGKWLAENSYKYGFIIRYPNGAKAKVGYEFEPWHVRYLGRPLASEVHKSGQTLEEYFGLPPAPTY